MPNINLTDLSIKSLSPAARTDYWDDQLPSFGIRVGARTKVFLVKVKNRRITIGRYPNLTLKDARRRAHVLLGSYIEKGSVPFQEARTDFFKEYCDQNNKATTAAETKRLLKRFTFSGDLNSITKRRILDTTKNFSPSEANHAFAAMRTFLNWCVENDYLAHTPLSKVRMPHRSEARDRLLTDDELKVIWTETFNHNSFGRIIRSLILSGQRLNQVSSFRADWTKDDTIAFPGTIMKSNRDHTIPLTARLKENLPALATPFANHSRAMRAFRKSLEDNDKDIPHWTLHDLRRYFSSTCARLRIPLDITEAILDHTTGSRSPVQQIYDRYDRLEPMRRALERYETFLFTSVLAERNG